MTWSSLIEAKISKKWKNNFTVFVSSIHNSHVLYLHSSHPFDLKSQSGSRESCNQEKKEWKKKNYRVKHSNETLTFTCPQGLLCNKSRGLIFIQIESICCFAPVWRGSSSDAGRDSGPFPPSLRQRHALHYCVILLFVLPWLIWLEMKDCKGIFRYSLYSPGSKTASEFPFGCAGWE